MDITVYSLFRFGYKWLHFCLLSSYHSIFFTLKCTVNFKKSLSRVFVLTIARRYSRSRNNASLRRTCSGNSKENENKEVEIFEFEGKKWKMKLKLKLKKKNPNQAFGLDVRTGFGISGWRWNEKTTLIQTNQSDLK